MFRVIRAVTAGLSAVLLFTMPAKALEVYLFRGAGDFSFVNENLNFSRGLDRMAETLNQEGIRAEVRRFGATGDAMAAILKRKPESVAFIGHSMGAVASLSMARRMREAGIRVAYVGLIDIPGPVGSVGNNVERAENYYSIFPVYARLTNADTHPNAKNIHVFGQIHTTIDDSKTVRQGMLAALREIQAEEQRLAREPEQLLAETTPLLLETDPILVAAPLPAGGSLHPAANLAPEPLVTDNGNTGLALVPQAGVGQSGDDVGYGEASGPAQPEIDLTTTASITASKVVDTGRVLLDRVRGFLSRANPSPSQRAMRSGR